MDAESANLPIAAEFVAQGFQITSLLEKYHSHPLLQGPPFFTLPRPLLETLVKEVGVNQFEKDLLAMEYALADLNGDHTQRIGFWGREPIVFNLFRTAPLHYSDEALKLLGQQLNQGLEEIQQNLARIDERRQRFTNVQRGYLGWLMTNPDFLAEQEAQFSHAEWRSLVAEYGVPHMGTALRDAGQHPAIQEATGDLARFLKDFEKFFRYWRLIGMAAPFAPLPLSPLLPAVATEFVTPHMQQCGVTLYLPDIFPVPSRDELRGILEDCFLDGRQESHLAEWFALVRGDQASRNQISRYARIFELQHYVRALYSRHATSLNRKKTSVDTALASFLEVSPDAIQNDLGLITGRLGSDWHLPKS